MNDVTMADVVRMRELADWWESPSGGRTEYPDDSPESFALLAENCRMVADRVEAAIIGHNQDLANREAAQWPDAAGPRN